MKISKKELIQLLCDHLGSDEASISSQFDKLMADIQKATNKGDKFSINGFGEFLVEEGFLSFNVAPVFASEINYNYEGLMPVDIDKPDILFPAESIEGDIDKPGVKTSNIVIVDEDVAGEEDPYEGIADEMEETKDEDLVEQEERTDEADSEIEDIVDDAPFESDDQAEVELEQPKSVSADLDPEELAALEELKNNDLGTESYEDDPFADLGEGDSILIDNKVSEFNEELIDDETKGDFTDDFNEGLNEDLHEQSLGSEETETDAESDEAFESSNEESLEEQIGKALNHSDEEEERSDGPAIIPVASTKAIPSVLDEFFDDDSTVDSKTDEVADNTLHSSEESTDSDDIFGMDETASADTESDQGNGETNVEYDSGGPRVVSIKEAESEEKLSFGKLLPIAAIVLIVALIGGGAWWFLMGPGSETNTQSQTLVVQAPQQTDTNATDNQQEGVESFQTGESIPLGSADDDPEPPVDVVDETAGTEIGPEASSDIAESTPTGSTQSTQAAAAQVSDPIVATPQNEPEPADNTQATPTGNQNTQSQQTGFVESSSTNTSFGLTGPVAELQGTVFSIIVHSLPSRQAAQIECDKITQLNLRCLVREANGPQGRRTFRVGIGQFATADVAQSELTKLPEPFRSRNFIARIN
ncbi:MAG TPA: hypothetical protein DCE78_07270 [Bacteroidetes bacterium]|nr:hypothetical protein [Bacteroidota bacterium]